MSKSKDILAALLKEDLLEAKKLINESLLEKLGNALEQKLVDFAPTVFESQASSEGLKGNQKKLDANKNGKIDGQDFKLLKKKKKANEDVETEDMNALVEEFESELATIVHEIQEETGQELSEEEIMQLADDYLNALSEETEEDEEDDEECEDCSSK
jgi:hypothetical protein